MTSSPLHGWLSGHHDSRLGASHRRRGAPCQDASGSIRFRDRNGRGELIQVLAVSDGHGGSRYDRSDLGSWLACQVALRAVKDCLEPMDCRRSSPGALEEWRQWLAEGLPRRLVAEWRQAVQSHARAHPRSESPQEREEPPSTVPYGATLGLLVLTPHWWGYTGLGDWDLVRLPGAGAGELISEEPPSQASGEATYSLCMERAERHFLGRSGLVSLEPEAEPFSLLLSTDGIRKSCGSDADFYALAQYLVTLPAPDRRSPTSELGKALDHISQQGSGDDVSAAIARWQHRDGGRFTPPRVGKELIVQPPAVPLTTVNDSRKLPTGAENQAGGGPADRSRDATRDWRHVSAPWRLALLGLILAGAGLGAAVLLGWGPFGRRWGSGGALSTPSSTELQKTADALCASVPPAPRQGGPSGPPVLSQGPGSLPAPADPTTDATTPDGQSEAVESDPKALPPEPASWPPATEKLNPEDLDPDLLAAIRGHLNNQKATFEALLRRPPSTDPQAETNRPPDPAVKNGLGDLIAWSYGQPGIGPAAASSSPLARGTSQSKGTPRIGGWGPIPPLSLPGWRWLPAPRPAGAPPPPARPKLCSELSAALAGQWRRLLPETPDPHRSRPERSTAAPLQGSAGSTGSPRGDSKPRPTPSADFEQR
ncbi:MAG: protein phosphatase 2C domain-containing protein [Cyanobium sp.]